MDLQIFLLVLVSSFQDCQFASLPARLFAAYWCDSLLVASSDVLVKYIY
jgi:hypothetical protein